MSEKSIQADVAIVGAGGCGLTAALAAAEEGARVLLIERDEKVGGTTAMSAGLFVAAGSKMAAANGEKGTADELAADIFRMNGDQSDRQVTLALCHASGPLMDWLADRGVPLEHLPAYRYLGMSHAWLHAPPERHGGVMTAALLAAVRRQPAIDLRLGAAVTGLITSAGSVEGLRAETPDGESIDARAPAVILAASGFGANPALVSRHIPELSGAPYFGAPFANGDAITWGQALGAAVDHMSAYQSHSSIAYPEMMLVTTYLINHGAIQVNQHGRRFGDETDSYAGHALAVQAQPGGSVIELFDERILKQSLANYPRFEECMAAGLVHRGETLSEVARHFDLKGDELFRTVSRYNAAIAAGRDEFGRDRFGQPLEAPYYAIRVTSALVQTLGGLRVDSQARVLRMDGRPLPGLYAGGGTAAGLGGDRPEGYMAGAGLLAAFGLGWIAGRHAVQL